MYLLNSRKLMQMAKFSALLNEGLGLQDQVFLKTHFIIMVVIVNGNNKVVIIIIIIGNNLTKGGSNLN